MATTQSKPLNAEPADPQERKEHSLPPKSFADAVQKTPVGDSQPQSPIKSYASSATAVDDKEQLDEDKIAFEKHTNASRTAVLASVKPDESYERSLKHNGATAPREKKEADTPKRQDPPEHPLASGRQAGAGWQRSAYALVLLLKSAS